MQNGVCANCSRDANGQSLIALVWTIRVRYESAPNDRGASHRDQTQNGRATAACTLWYQFCWKIREPSASTAGSDFRVLVVHVPDVRAIAGRATVDHVRYGLAQPVLARIARVPVALVQAVPTPIDQNRIVRVQFDVGFQVPAEFDLVRFGRRSCFPRRLL